MKKVSSKLMVLTIFCCIFISLLICSSNLYLGIKYINQEAIQKLSFMASVIEFSLSLKKTESYVDTFHSHILASFDMESFRQNSYSLEKYEKVISRCLYAFTGNNNGAFSMYDEKIG